MSNQYNQQFKTEAQLTKHVKKWLGQQDDLFFWKASERFIAGIPDFVVCVRGIFVGLELKDDTGKLSANQKLIANKIVKAGGIWAECRTVQDAIDAIDAARKKLL